MTTWEFIPSIYLSIYQKKKNKEGNDKYYFIIWILISWSIDLLIRLPLVCWRASNDNSFVIIVISMMNRENNLSNIINTVTSWFKNEFFTIFKKKKIVYLSAPAAHDNNMIWMNELSRNLENILVGANATCF